MHHVRLTGQTNLSDRPSPGHRPLVSCSPALEAPSPDGSTFVSLNVFSLFGAVHRDCGTESRSQASHQALPVRCAQLGPSQSRASVQLHALKVSVLVGFGPGQQIYQSHTENKSLHVGTMSEKRGCGEDRDPAEPSPDASLSHLGPLINQFQMESDGVQGPSSVPLVPLRTYLLLRTSTSLLPLYLTNKANERRVRAA